MSNFTTIAASLAVSRSIAFHARLPGLDGKHLLALANHLQQTGRNAAVLVNDRVDVARIADCAGVHLPSKGLPISAARNLLGSEKLVGRSTHSADEARRALDD